MFGKLLKYDFRSMLKQFAFIWPAALVLAVINRFTLNGLDSSSAVGETTAGITMLVYVAILVAMFAVTMIFVIQRFFKGLLGDEGYLMHTLPVRPWELIGSKLLCAVATTLLSIVVAICSILFIVPWDGVNWGEVFSGLRYVLPTGTATPPTHSSSSWSSCSSSAWAPPRAISTSISPWPSATSSTRTASP